jgi:site-specific recombinase XerD
MDAELARSWVWSLAEAAMAGSSLRRKVSALKGFTAWLAREGHTEGDVGVRLRAPGATRSLPRVLTRHHMEDIFQSLQNHAATGDPIALRDLAIIEVLYASAIRVGELVSLTLAGVDVSSGTLRVVGKGDKERVVPLGTPAVLALKSYLTTPGEPFSVRGPHRGFFSPPEASQWAPEACIRWSQDCSGRHSRCGAAGSPHASAHRCDPPTRWWS